MPNVFVNKLHVGALDRAPDAHRFQYAPGPPPAAAVSLLMPVPPPSTPAPAYPADRPGRLHPVFDMNLPEGELRATLERLFAKALPFFDDYALLQIVGRSLVGRLRFAENRAQLESAAPPAQNLSDLLRANGTHDLFRGLVERYAQFSGISGVQPKLLVRDDGTLLTSSFSPPIHVGDRCTYPGATHIVKAFDPEKYPALAVNEYICLQAARNAGLPVPVTHLARDEGLLVIERFDLRPDGTYRAFEDTCALAGRLSSEKYDGSYEQIAKTLATCLRTSQGSAAERRRFFKMIVLSVVIRNGDAHRKNFGVLYDDAHSGDVTLAPAFDILTTSAYLPNDTMALTIEGTKRWATAKQLLRFGLGHCQLTQTETRSALEEVIEGVAQTRPALKRIPDAELRQKVTAAWERGLTDCSLAPKIATKSPTPGVGRPTRPASPAQPPESPISP